MSLLSHPETWGDDDPVFVLLDHDMVTTRFAYGVPMPLQAAKLLQDHGKVPDELDQP